MLYMWAMCLDAQLTYLLVQAGLETGDEDGRGRSIQQASESSGTWYSCKDTFLIRLAISCWMSYVVLLFFAFPCDLCLRRFKLLNSLKPVHHNSTRFFHNNWFLLCWCAYSQVTLIHFLHDLGIYVTICPLSSDWSSDSAYSRRSWLAFSAEFSDM